MLEAFSYLLIIFPASFSPLVAPTKKAMKSSAKKIQYSRRSEEKSASRRSDRQRLEHGECPEAIQQENSIFPAGYFEKNRILNFASAIGK
jgi:hypothetical protein